MCQDHQEEFAVDQEEATEEVTEEEPEQAVEVVAAEP